MYQLVIDRSVALYLYTLCILVPVRCVNYNRDFRLFLYTHYDGLHRSIRLDFVCHPVCLEETTNTWWQSP
jgi:hypothetical protein